MEDELIGFPNLSEEELEQDNEECKNIIAFKQLAMRWYGDFLPLVKNDKMFLRRESIKRLEEVINMENVRDIYMYRFLRSIILRLTRFKYGKYIYEPNVISTEYIKTLRDMALNKIDELEENAEKRCIKIKADTDKVFSIYNESRE